MEFRLLAAAFALLFVTVSSSSNTSASAEAYWQSMLPRTPMPKELHDLLKPVLPFKANASNETLDGISIFSNYRFSNYHFTYHFDYKFQYHFHYLGAGVPRPPVQKHALSNITIFFPYDDLHNNTKMKPLFAESSNKARFLPRHDAVSIPFSVGKLQEILDHFSISPKSVEAEVIQNTLQECEEPNIKGEDKSCATSLESLVDFIIAKLGKISVHFISVEKQQKTRKQEYTILKGIKMMGDNAVVCHKQRYPYAVFYCHVIDAIKIYMVPLVGADGTKTKAMVICHMDTSTWSPNHFAFQVLRLEPGPPICHFPDGDTFTWISNE